MFVLRRIFWLGLLTGAGVAAWTLWRDRTEPATAGPQWPPLPEDEPPAPGSMTPGTSTHGDDEAHAPRPRWVPPVDGGCPDGYPIKANDNSGIYHVPGGRFYDRTLPERCYADADAAEADGYRAAKA